MSEQLIETISRSICESQGLDPDDDAPRWMICGPNSETLPLWHRYTEEAKAAASVLSAEVERLRNIASDLQSLCDKQALALGDERAEVERLKGERDAAIMEVSRQAAARGRAEGALATSVTAGVIDGWRARAEAAGARVKALEEGPTNTYDDGVRDERKQWRDHLETLIREMRDEDDTDWPVNSDRKMGWHAAVDRIAAEIGKGNETGPLYEGKLSKALTRVKDLEEALRPFAKEADEWAETVPNEHCSLCTEPGANTAHPGSETVFSVGDLRRARSALSHTKEEG